jgi:hypothetical protein
MIGGVMATIETTIWGKMVTNRTTSRSIASRSLSKRVDVATAAVLSVPDLGLADPEPAGLRDGRHILYMKAFDHGCEIGKPKSRSFRIVCACAATADAV